MAKAPKDQEQSLGLWTAIKKKAVDHIASVVVVGGAGLIALAGTTTWAAFKNWTVVDFPEGAVVAFHFASASTVGNCPPGWSPFADVRGRVIIGDGPHENRDERGKKLKEHQHAANGGVETSRLTERELPPHSHEFRGGATMVPGKFRPMQIDQVAAPWNYEAGVAAGTVQSAGQGEEFTNMPPFLALRYCKKDRT